MAESPVNVLIGKLETLFKNEANLLRGIREEATWLRDELERLRAFLRIADALQDDDEELRIWVRQVRDISQGAEDLLAEYVLLQGHNHEPGLYGSISRWACCVKNMKSCYRVAAELKSINARLKMISDVQMRLSHKFTKAEHVSSAWKDCRNDSVLCDESDLVGIEGRRRKLVEWMIEGDSRRAVISLVGLGGIGKTTLAKQVYEDAEVKRRFKVRAWITVSQSFRIENILKDMVQQLFKAIRRRVPEVEAMDSYELKTTIKELMKKQAYLIVMDDVWDLHAWLAVQHALPNNSLGSRVVLTTRNADVASAACMESEGRTYYLKPLSASESWELLCRKTFHGIPCPPHLVEICSTILKKCEGLPLAIVAVGGVLATKSKSTDEWDMVARSLGEEMVGNSNLRDLKKVLSLSFNDLPYYLKACFVYLSIFPENHLVSRARLIRLWMAEGFIEGKEGKVLEDVADEYLNELVNRSLMQVATSTSYGRAKTYRVHDLLREIIVCKSRDQNFATVLKYQNAQWPDRARRLSVHTSLQHLQPNMQVSQLRSLFMFEVPEPLRLSKLFPGGFRLLTVLDLQNSCVTKFPVEVVNLFYLKYLSLRDTKVATVPRFIGKLQNLETLDLKHSQVSELPVEILKLRRLRYLLLYQIKFVNHQHFNSKSGFKSMDNIGALQSLQKLCFIEANQGSNMLIELGNLCQLSRLGILKLRREDGKFLCSSVEKLTNLRALSISSVEEYEIIDLQQLSTPPKLLQRLYIRGRLEIMPHWIPSLRSLVKLCLKWSRLKDDPLANLEDMPNLVHLVLCQVYTGQRLLFKAGGFKKLKILVLDEFDELQFIHLEEGAMTSLEDLSIKRCELLEKVPSGIEYLKKLKVLEFCDMPEVLFGSLHPYDSENWRVTHIPEVYSTYWRGEWKFYSESLSYGKNCPPPEPSMKTDEC